MSKKALPGSNALMVTGVVLVPLARAIRKVRFSNDLETISL